VNYVRAMNHGLGRLTVFSVSMRLVREVRETSLRGVRSVFN
jgi:hypothetical protein